MDPGRGAVLRRCLNAAQYDTELIETLKLRDWSAEHHAFWLLSLWCVRGMQVLSQLLQGW